MSVVDVLINSQNVTVFPSSQRNIDSSRLLTEQRITSIANKLLDVDGFVIASDAGGGLAEFNILGYYFKCALAGSVLSGITDGEDVYAKIHINTNNTAGGYMYYYLEGEDDQYGKYTGVSFLSVPHGSAPVSGATYRRGLYSYQGDYYLYIGTYLTANTNPNKLSGGVLPKINYVSIDCGTIS